MTTKTRRERANQNRIKAMASPTRALILRLLIEHKTLSPVQIEKLTEGRTSSSLASYHLKYLERIDCAELVKEEPAPGTGAVQHFYRPTVRHLIDTDEWLDLPLEVRETLLPEFFQPMVDDFSAAAGGGLLYEDEIWHITRTPLAVDSEGMGEAMEAFEDLRKAMIEIAKRSANRGDSVFPISSSLALFRMPSSSLSKD